MESMALHLDDARTEELVVALTRLTGETKVDAIRSALAERYGRLEQDRRLRAVRLRRFLAEEAWQQLPPEVRGAPLGKAERESLLGLV